jgi:hypothetical protein
MRFYWNVDQFILPYAPKDPEGAQFQLVSQMRNHIKKLQETAYLRQKEIDEAEGKQSKAADSRLQKQAKTSKTPKPTTLKYPSIEWTAPVRSHQPIVPPPPDPTSKLSALAKSLQAFSKSITYRKDLDSGWPEKWRPNNEIVEFDEPKVKRPNVSALRNSRQAFTDSVLYPKKQASPRWPAQWTPPVIVELDEPKVWGPKASRLRKLRVARNSRKRAQMFCAYFLIQVQALSILAC